MLKFKKMPPKVMTYLPLALCLGLGTMTFFQVEAGAADHEAPHAAEGKPELIVEAPAVDAHGHDIADHANDAHAAGAHTDAHHDAGHEAPPSTHTQLAIIHTPEPTGAQGWTIPPATFLLLGALLLAFLPKVLRPVLAVALPLVTLGYVLLALPHGAIAPLSVGDLELTPLRVDRLSTIFGLIFSLVGVVAGVYAWHENDRKQQVSAMLYNAGALGVTFAGDYFTLYAFWELMAVSSTILIWARNRPESQRAGMRYLIAHLVGGSILLAGVLLHVREVGSIAFEHIPYDTGDLSSWLILIGFALNAAVPPLGPWLPDAYPRATITGAIFCSALTTKTAVYTLIRGFAGWEILMVAGVVMALYGVVYAVLANDVRELLGYHIISQVGYMVAATGLGVELAINGAVAHAVCHILYKSVLFMGAGVVIDTTGREKMSDLGGFWQRQKLVLGLYMIGAFSISGFPFFNGFISKSMVTAAAHEMYVEHSHNSHDAHAEGASAGGLDTHSNSAQLTALGALRHGPESDAHTPLAPFRERWAGWMFMLLMLASVGTFLHTGLKLPLGVWFGEDKGIEPKPAKTNMLIGMGISGFFCFLLGVYPPLLYQFLPFEMTWEPYTSAHFWEMTQVLVFTFLAFYLYIPQLHAKPYISMDTDVIYRKLAPQAKMIFVDLTVWVYTWCLDFATRTAHRLIDWLRDPNIDIAINQTRVAADDPDFDPDRARYPVGFSLALVLMVLFALGFLALNSIGSA